jgi:homospermidine synthase
VSREKRAFSGKIVILGCGAIAQCALPIMFKLMELDPKKITIIDFADKRSRVEEFLKMGVRFVQDRLTEENYEHLLKTHLSAGDMLLDLSWNVETVTLIDWCHHHDVLYINTSVEVWDPFDNMRNKHPTEMTLYPRQMALRKMISKWKNQKTGPTAIVDHGANPGLVSSFIKQGLIDIAQALLKEKPQDSRRPALERALQERDFPQLSYLLGVKTVHISEKDTQIASLPKRENEFVNTWSVMGLIEEGLAPAEMGWGTHEQQLPLGAMSYEEGPCNQICLSQKGVKTWVRSWVPSGEITGMVIRHGEAFSISDYLTVREGESVVYRPTVHYAYCPSNATINSLHELEMRHYEPQESERIMTNEIIEGRDELGCLIMGHDFKSWWIGSILDIHEARKLVPGQSATTVQVAVGVVSAVMYAINHPNEGFCLPDNLNFEEILAVAKPYLGNFVSMGADWTPLDHAAHFTDYLEKPPAKEEMWQFTTFLLNK